MKGFAVPEKERQHTKRGTTTRFVWAPIVPRQASGALRYRRYLKPVRKSTSYIHMGQDNGCNWGPQDVAIAKTPGKCAIDFAESLLAETS